MFERKKQAGKIYFLPIDQIRPSPFQARREFSEQELAALAQSIRENGLLQPVTVRNPFEQAQGMKDVMVLWDCTQAEAAKRLGMAQPTLANKLRLLQLNADQRQFVLDNNLTERHARAVLRLPENRRSEALINIAKRRMNARQTDLYIDHAIRLMTDNGVPATAHREEKDGYIEYTVRIPTAAAER